MDKKTNPLKATFSGKLKPKDSLFGGSPESPQQQEAVSVTRTENEARRATETAYTELVTLPLTKAQKELIEDLGTKLQRNKLGKKVPPLNWKSVLRGLIALLDEQSFDGVSVANEEELHKVIRKRFAL